MKNNIITIQTDGGARGNPGPAAAAFVVRELDQVIYKGSEFLGSTTNNIAEYEGVLMAFRWIKRNKKELRDKTLEFLLDSELVVRQLIGVYKVKDENLRKLYLQILDIIDLCDNKIIFKHIPRSQNAIADELVNQTLDNSLIR